MFNFRMMQMLFCSVVAFQAANALAADSYKMMNVSLPIFSAAKVEFNLKGNGGLAAEVNLQREKELYSKDEIREKNGDSIMAKGVQLAILFSQYSNPKMMSGGFWSLGVGYRTFQADWQKSPNDSSQTAALNADGKVEHKLLGTGATGHARVGYRYVAESFPFLAGIYLGLRHFQSDFKDKDQDLSVQTSDADLEALERRLATSLEAGLEIGLAF